MDDSQRAEFAANGYIVIKGVLSAEVVDELNAGYDANHPQLHPGREGHREAAAVTDRHGSSYEGQPRFWSAAYRNLVDNPTMLPILRELLGDPAWGHAPANLPAELRPRLRLDHHNFHYRRPLSAEEGAVQYENGAPNLHGDAEGHHVTCVYVSGPCTLVTLTGRARSLKCAD